MTKRNVKEHANKNKRSNGDGDEIIISNAKSNNDVEDNNITTTTRTTRTSPASLPAIAATTA